MDNESKDICHREEARIPVAAICPLLNQHLVNSKVCRTATNCVRCLPSRGQYLTATRCRPAENLSKYEICSDRSRFCPIAKASKVSICPNMFYNFSKDMSKYEHRECCKEQIQLGQKVTCSSTWRKNERPQRIKL